MRNKLDRIIEEATTDAYGEYEQFAGWFCFLEDKITVPQECAVKGEPAIITKVVQAESGLGVYAEVRFNKKGVPVPVEYIVLKNKRQNSFIEAYKKWL